jgi:hypothetical protein
MGYKAQTQTQTKEGRQGSATMLVLRAGVCCVMTVREAGCLQCRHVSCHAFTSLPCRLNTFVLLNMHGRAFQFFADTFAHQVLPADLLSSRC